MKSFILPIPFEDTNLSVQLYEWLSSYVDKEFVVSRLNIDAVKIDLFDVEQQDLLAFKLRFGL